VFSLHDVVPWGRSFDEYRAMFGLTDADLGRRILGCGDGPASFNALATKHGATVCSCDPLYLHAADEIRSRIMTAYPVVLEQFRQNREQFTWQRFGTIDFVRDDTVEAHDGNHERQRAEGQKQRGSELPWPQLRIEQVTHGRECQVCRAWHDTLERPLEHTLVGACGAAGPNEYLRHTRSDRGSVTT
jgi:hypothetical protein